MTKFKVGDRVKLVKVGGSVPISFGYKVGDIASIVEIRDMMTIVIKMDSGPEEKRTLFVCSNEIEAASPLIPPETIQHEGYNYTRGEPVVPEWVKDGAWVVNRENGELNQLIAGDPGYFKAVNKKTWHAFVLDFHPSMSVSDVFRPFTNEDWKWGMWAEYKGEKVFVHGTGLTGIFASRPGNGYFPAPFSEITPTTAP